MTDKNEQVATCIGCGCDDLHACTGGCGWLRVDRHGHRGICTNCAHLVPRWDRNRKLGWKWHRLRAAPAAEHDP